MKTSNITAHMVIKNEDVWVWHAVKSVLPYVDYMLITDTGSTDNTLKIIKSIKSKKIKLTISKVNSPAELTKIRQAQLDATTTPWIWIIDGDEIYPERTAQEIAKVVKDNACEGILVRRHDLLGDIYHAQDESVGEYNLFGHRGHLVTRLVNIDKIKGLKYQGDYPLEGFVDQSGKSTRDRNPDNWYLTANYLHHTMYLRRSSEGANLKAVLHRSKHKIETGHRLSGKYPEVFNLPRPSLVPDPLTHRSLSYQLMASLITPIKKLKRKVMK